MTTKFNQDMYAKMRSKKNEPLSNLGKRTMRVIGKGLPATPAAPVALVVPGTEAMRAASPVTSAKEITIPISKRPHLTDKGKEKANSCVSSIWDDVELAVERAHEVVTTENLKVFTGVPSNEVVARHVHRLIQVTYLCNFSPFFLFSLFFVCSLEAPIFYSGVGGESLDHGGVPHPRSQGRVYEVQDGSSGGRELQAKERLNCCHGRGQYL